MQYLFGELVLVVDDADSEIDNREGESADGKADAGVKNGVFGFFKFASVTCGSHVADATDDDENYRNSTEDANDAV